MAKEKKNLYQKILTVMEAVDRVEKRGRNEFHKYDYVLEADLIEAVRKTLIEEGVFVFASVVEERTSTAGTEDKPKQITSVKTKYKFVNVDNPEESEEVLGFGQGEDQGDKGGYKAITGAMKYFLMKTFLIPTGDDPENDGETPVKRPKETSKSHRSDVEEEEDGEISVEDDEDEEEEEKPSKKIKEEEDEEDDEDDDKEPVKLSAKELSQIKPITQLLKNAVSEAELKTAKKAAKIAKDSLNENQLDYLVALFEETQARLEDE